jgi:DNA-binding CsgD family transcriptional regulator
VESLTQAQLLQLSKVLRSLYEPYSLDEFPARSLSALSELVGAEVYSHVSFASQNGTLPHHYTFPKMEVGIAAESFTIQRQYFLEHPLVQNYFKTLDGQALAISDFITEKEFHGLEVLYARFMKPFGLEDHMAIVFKNTLVPGEHLSLSLGRDRRNFTECDRLILNLMRPHFQQAYQNATAFTQVHQKLIQLDQTIDQVGLIALSVDCKVQWITQKADKLLHQYFPTSKPKTSLPNLLQRWLKQQISAIKQSTKMPMLCYPLCLEQNRQRLIVRFQYHETIEQIHLLLEEIQTDGFLLKSLEMLGLTKREAEVLFWIAKDQSTPEIAQRLGICERTVKKHLEHIYAKFGVQTRVAAVMYALEKLGIVNL